METVSLEIDPVTTPAERAKEYLAFAAGARSRADRLMDAAQSLFHEAEAARRFTEDARARINGLRSGTDAGPDASPPADRSG